MPSVNNVMLTNMGSYLLFNNLVRLSDPELTTVLLQYKEASLNYQYNIQMHSGDMYPGATAEDDKRVALRYVTIGIGGNGYNDITHTKVPFNPSAANANLYYPIPVKILTIADDKVLPSNDRAELRLRQEVTVGGVDYAIYWLRKATVDATSFNINELTNPPSAITFANLKGPDNDGNGQPDPVPFLPNAAGSASFTADATTITASAMEVSFSLPRDDIKNVINVLFEGDLSYGVISEFGLCVGADIDITTVIDGTSVTWTEAHNTYLAMHQCTNGVDLMVAGDAYEKTLILADNNAVIQ